jgi:hypothetical protein
MAINDMEALGWVSDNCNTTFGRRELSQSCGGVRRESYLLDEFRGLPVTLLQPVEDSALSWYCEYSHGTDVAADLFLFFLW